jgi:cytochrome b involved in lipid metabolism
MSFHQIIVIGGGLSGATSFLNKHPGGKQVLLLWAGKDASTEFNMFHKKDAIMKYAPEIILGNIIQPKL